MRLVLLALVVSACGGGGRCENPPCEIPPMSCESSDDCFESEVCDFPFDSCGRRVEDTGQCRRRPSSANCNVVQREAACGCDGQTYASSCDAAAAGVDTDRDGGCPAPPGAFTCGPRFCDRFEQICVETTFGPSSTDFRCEDFPPQCRSNRTCNCIDPGGFQDCRETDGGFTVTQEVVADPAEDTTSSVAAPSASTTASR